MVFEELLDVGFDYGVSGGPEFLTEVIENAAGLEPVRAQLRARPRRRFQLGNRRVDSAFHDYMLGFFLHKRGRRYGFLLRDWQDYRAAQQPLEADGEPELQLVKTYGGAVDPLVRQITRPVVSTVVIEQFTGGNWVTLTPTTNYTLDSTTGLITWVTTPPDSPDLLRWSGEFNVPVRFDADQFPSQFLSYEDRGAEEELAYALGSLSVVELLDE